MTLANYPNPFNPSTTIDYALADPARARLTVYNTLGQTVRILADSYQSAGRHSVRWDGRDALGYAVTSGVYIYRLQAGDEVLSEKMVLAR